MYARGRRGNDRIGKAGANSGEMNFEKTKSTRARCEYPQGTTLLELVHFISFHFPPPPPLNLPRIWGYTFVPLKGIARREGKGRLFQVLG